MTSTIRESIARHFEQLALSGRAFERLRPELGLGWWVTRTPSMWVRTGSPRDELLKQTRETAWHASGWPPRFILAGVLRLLTLRARKVSATGSDSSFASRWQALLQSGNGDCLLFDWTSGAVARESLAGRFTEEYFSIRERMARHVAVPELLAALPPSRQVERLVQGRPVLSLSSAVQVDAAQFFLGRFSSLVANEALDVPPSATLPAALESFQAAGGASTFQLEHIEPALDRLDAASRSWSVVPSHGDANLYHAICAENGYLLIDTAKCGPRYEWHDSVHLMMFSGSSAVRDAVMTGQIASPVVGTRSSIGSVSSTYGTTFEDFVLAFVLVGSREAASRHPPNADVFTRSLRWHLSQPGVRAAIARIEANP
jgi:hypothetical protein